jgi:hypothetical protein
MRLLRASCAPPSPDHPCVETFIRFDASTPRVRSARIKTPLMQLAR